MFIRRIDWHFVFQTHIEDIPRHSPWITYRTDTTKGIVMNSIVLLTALTATSGIFGGGSRQQTCTTGQCGTAYAAPVARTQYVAAPAAQYTAAPAPQYYTQAAPIAQPAMARRAWFRPARTAFAAPATTCANGTCYRR